MTSLMWFRQDLRLDDNPALARAVRHGPVLPIYVHDETDPMPLGEASRWWLDRSLAALKEYIPALLVLTGDPIKLIPQLAAEASVSQIFWNRCYEPHAVHRDTEIKSLLQGQGIDVESFNGDLLREPWQVENGSGEPYRVFTPFMKNVNASDVASPVAAVSSTDIETINIPEEAGRSQPTFNPAWASHWSDIWTPGEQGAIQQFQHFLEHGLECYKTLRDRPDLENTSRLSPHLHFGEISVRRLFASLDFLAEAHPERAADISKFRSELIWREFSRHLLFHFPNLPTRNWKREFDSFPWKEPDENYLAWTRGRTGLPIVDAGMRELWQTGYMHNRVRMVVASFLTKHLGIHWSHGEAWFRDTLVDADLANNAASWQWVAGSGADAAPFFRIFNPYSQADRFDPQGSYVQRWCPEYRNGAPEPIIDLKAARQQALDAWASIRQDRIAG